MCYVCALKNSTKCLIPESAPWSTCDTRESTRSNCIVHHSPPADTEEEEGNRHNASGKKHLTAIWKDAMSQFIFSIWCTPGTKKPTHPKAIFASDVQSGTHHKLLWHWLILLCPEDIVTEQRQLNSRPPHPTPASSPHPTLPPAQWISRVRNSCMARECV